MKFFALIAAVSAINITNTGVHNFGKCDKNKDQVLTKGEIRNCYGGTWTPAAFNASNNQVRGKKNNTLTRDEYKVYKKKINANAQVDTAAAKDQDAFDAFAKEWNKTNTFDQDAYTKELNHASFKLNAKEQEEYAKAKAAAKDKDAFAKEWNKANAKDQDALAKAKEQEEYAKAHAANKAGRAAWKKAKKFGAKKDDKKAIMKAAVEEYLKATA